MQCLIWYLTRFLAPTHRLGETSEAIFTDTPTELWRTYGARSGLDHEEFLQYFTGVEVGAALTLEHAECFKRPLPLADLRKKP